LFKSLNLRKSKNLFGIYLIFAKKEKVYVDVRYDGNDGQSERYASQNA
jgi:hypothetical protein